MITALLMTLESETERKAIADIYEEHKNICYTKAFSIAQNNEMAEDAVHDAFAEIIKHKEETLSKTGSELKSWLLVIVKNKALDILRKRKDTDDIDELEIQSDEKPVDMQVIDKFKYEELMKQINKLDEKYKVAFEMKYIFNLSNAQIATEMNISVKNVEMRVYRAKQILRKILESEAVIDV
jgi:RNA polymerase sigma-70 factor (ECF subfamily)